MEKEKTKKKLFVSLPMTGRNDEDVIKRMNEVLHIVNYYAGFDNEFELINTMEPDPEPEGVVNHCWYLGQSIQKLAMADLIVFDYDYVSANGCAIEKHIALLYNIPSAFMSVKNTLLVPDDISKPEIDTLDIPIILHKVND